MSTTMQILTGKYDARVEGRMMSLTDSHPHIGRIVLHLAAMNLDWAFGRHLRGIGREFAQAKR